MKEANEDILKKLIQQSGPETAPSDFTEFVMSAVQVESQHESIVNLELKTVLQQNALDQPSADFLLRVMSQVEVQQMSPVLLTEVKPIISPKVWYWLGSIAASLVILIAFFYQSLEKISDEPTSLSLSDKAFSNISESFISIPPLYSISCIAITGLLLTDYFLRNRFMKRLV
ncbi:hypothetical protein [Dyadobacter sp. CY312]|uniref:hypothetical protein n=1 Tax=Dyadobacter sp. CY312 TaxID=2907303 RepID=UPI001F1BC5FD|nr:hypothetical protein [Dyadobacter sp. CY312]MCE7040630.1 hypothetical protein [Dyadobacter sp. CY312]